MIVKVPILLVFCVVFFTLFVFVLCLVSSVVCVSGLFIMIAPLTFSNVYFKGISVILLWSVVLYP